MGQEGTFSFLSLPCIERERGYLGTILQMHHIGLVHTHIAFSSVFWVLPTILEAGHSLVPYYDNMSHCRTFPPPKSLQNGGESIKTFNFLGLKMPTPCRWIALARRKKDHGLRIPWLEIRCISSQHWHETDVASTLPHTTQSKRRLHQRTACMCVYLIKIDPSLSCYWNSPFAHLSFFGSVADVDPPRPAKSKRVHGERLGMCSRQIFVGPRTEENEPNTSGISTRLTRYCQEVATSQLDDSTGIKVYTK